MCVGILFLNSICSLEYIDSQFLKTFKIIYFTVLPIGTC
jgi:hypothetical protein